MIMTGLYRFALHPGADAKAFEHHLTTEMFTDPNVLQLTRNTRGFSHELLKATRRTPGALESISPNPGPQYLWEATVDLQTPAGYDFDENADRVQERVAQFATLIAVDSYARIESGT